VTKPQETPKGVRPLAFPGYYRYETPDGVSRSSCLCETRLDAARQMARASHYHSHSLLTLASRNVQVTGAIVLK